jgi:ferrous iron transport protein A
VQIINFENDEIVIKLMEMGCIPGETMVVENRGPWGDPMSILVSGYRLSLRISEADSIIVKAITD